MIRPHRLAWTTGVLTGVEKFFSRNPRLRICSVGGKLPNAHLATGSSCSCIFAILTNKKVLNFKVNLGAFYIRGLFGMCIYVLVIAIAVNGY